MLKRLLNDQKISISKKIDFLSVALYTLHLTSSATFITINNEYCVPKLYKFSRLYTNINKVSLYHLLDKVSIIQYLINVMCEKKIHNISLILLSESYKEYPIYSKYLQKYKLVLRKSCPKNFVGSHHYHNDNYINTLALLNLRLILICSSSKGTYILWLYLMYYDV